MAAFGVSGRESGQFSSEVTRPGKGTLAAEAISSDRNYVYTYAGWKLAIDMRVLAALALGTLIVGLAVGLLPALQSSRIDLRSKLMEESRQTSSQRVAWWRRTLVTVEIAGCLVLLSAAGLLIRSYVKLQETPLGFDRSNVLTLQMSPQGPRYDKEGRTVSFVAEALSQIRSLPGVEAAAIASNLPAQRGLNITYRTAAGQLTSPDWRYITPDYFKVFRISPAQRPISRGNRPCGNTGGSGQ